ncbi:hypothetical protein ACO1O0_002633 [Amphichorda felina]
MGLSRMLDSVLAKGQAKRRARRSVSLSPHGAAEKRTSHKERRSRRRYIADLDRELVRLDQKWDKLYGVYRGKMEMYRELESMLHRLRNQKSSNLPATRTWLAALYHLFLTVIRRYRLQATPGSFSTSERNLRDAVFLYGCDIDMRKAAMEAMNYKMQWVDAHRLYQKRIYERAGDYSREFRL